MVQLAPGRGILELSFVAGRTAVTRAQATYPLKLLLPRPRRRAAWVFTSTFGGGLVDGDEVDLEVRVGPKASCVLTTQSATKVYRSSAGNGCRQVLNAVVDDQSLLLLVPDPVICFAEAKYEQVQRVDMASGGGLVAVEWLSSGRRERGERWAFVRYRSRFDVHVDRDHVLAETLLLDPVDGPIASRYRMGAFDCLAVVVLVGQALSDATERLVRAGGSSVVGNDGECTFLEAVSPIRHGAILRVLGPTPERVGQYLRDKLSFLADHLGEAPWARKW